jgi:hypothetical protein
LALIKPEGQAAFRYSLSQNGMAYPFNEDNIPLNDFRDRVIYFLWQEGTRDG